MWQDFEHEYKGFGRVPSKCRVMIIKDENIHLICFEDLGYGTSVTNASEQLASEIVQKFNLDPKTCRFFETYEQYDNDTFDEIVYTWNLSHGNWIATKPDWIFSPDDIRTIFMFLKNA